MKKLIATDNSLKIISVLIAIFIWVYIALVMDPAVEVTVRDIPIQFIGQETLNTRGLSVISESATSINIKIKGSRRKMGNYNMKTIVAKADVSNIGSEGENSIPVEIVVPFENQGITSQSAYSIDVMIERFVEKKMEVIVKTTGTLAESYMSGDITVNPKEITIEGPESAVEQISQAAAVLSFDGEDVDIDVELPVEFYGENNKKIPTLDAMLKRIKVLEPNVQVHCPVLKIREISPTVNFGNQLPPENFSYKTEPDVLYVYGDDPNFIHLTEIKTEEVPIGKLLENEKLKVKLVVPDGVKILYDIKEIEVSVNKN